GEAVLDAVTALSGSGPAFVYLFAESLIEGGVRGGLPQTLAAQLAYATLGGAAAMLGESGLSTRELRDMVTSPGGTTLAGLGALEAHHFRDAIIAAVEAATRRARELPAARRRWAWGFCARSRGPWLRASTGCSACTCGSC